MSLLPKITIDTSGESTRLARQGFLLGVVLFLIFMLWASLAPIKGAVIASGRIIDFNRKVVQHLEGGIIKKILVREGSEVKAGEAVILLENIATGSQLNILTDRYWASLAKISRLQSQRLHTRKINFTEQLKQQKTQKISALIKNETALLNSIISSYLEQKTLLELQIEQIGQEINSRKEQIESIKSNISLIKQELNINTELIKDGYVDKTKIWFLKRTLAEKREAISSHHASIIMAQEKQTGIRLKIISLTKSNEQTADDQIKETKKQLDEVAELLRPAQSAYKRSSVNSPLDGNVINLKFKTIGGIIKPGEKIMEIVPKESDLIIEVKINTRDIDNIHLGQKTMIQVLSYNSRKTPLLPGKLKYISGDAVEDISYKGSHYYPTHIQVSKDALKKLGKTIKLFPGMPVTAFIQTRERTFMDFILEPVVDNMRRAFREE